MAVICLTVPTLLPKLLNVAMLTDKQTPEALRKPCHLNNK